jgi:hypothetical protein
MVTDFKATLAGTCVYKRLIMIYMIDYVRDIEIYIILYFLFMQPSPERDSHCIALLFSHSTPQ